MENTAYMVKVKKSSNYWLGGYYGANNLGSITQGKIYQKKFHAEQAKKKVEELYKLPVQIVRIIIQEIQDE